MSIYSIRPPMSTLIVVETNFAAIRAFLIYGQKDYDITALC